jgi:hypothetical protein
VRQPDHSVAEIDDGGGVMGYKDHRAVLHEGTEESHALLHEERVADTQCLVDDQNVSFHVRDHGEGQPHEHAAGVCLHRLVDELADIGEFDNGVVLAAQLLVRKSQQGTVEEHVLAAGEIRIEARPKLQQCRNPSVDQDLAFRWRQRAAQQLQQRGLARPVASDDADRFTLANLNETSFSAQNWRP